MFVAFLPNNSSRTDPIGITHSELFASLGGLIEPIRQPLSRFSEASKQIGVAPDGHGASLSSDGFRNRDISAMYAPSIGGAMKTALVTIVVFLSAAALNVPATCQTADKAASKKASQEPEIPKSISGSVAGTMQYVQGNLLGIAEAMPEDRYSFIPTKGNFEGVRSFGEQIKHVACAQFAFFNEFEGKKPPDDCEKGGHDTARTKSELL
ncbi:MAG TPA: hypothetical protein VF126_05765, partial [Acidobacteriaceae bacterium]